PDIGYAALHVAHRFRGRCAVRVVGLSLPRIYRWDALEPASGSTRAHRGQSQKPGRLGCRPSVHVHDCAEGNEARRRPYCHARRGTRRCLDYCFWIAPEHWGQGLAAEAAKAVIEFGFSRVDAKVIRGAHATWNAQSKRVFEKLGMRLTGENPCGFEKNGKV